MATKKVLFNTGCPGELSRVGVNTDYSDQRQLSWAPCILNQQNSIRERLLTRTSISKAAGGKKKKRLYTFEFVL